MALRPTIYIDDLALPPSQRLVLGAQLRQHAAFDHELRFLSQLTLERHWAEVETSGALALAHLLRCVSQGETPFIWLHGMLLITAALPDPFDAGGDALRLQPDSRLALQPVLLVDPVGTGMTALRVQAEVLLAGSFHAATDAVLPGAALTPAWQPGAWFDSRRGSLADVRPFTARPWLNADAPSARGWEQALVTVLGGDAAVLEAEVIGNNVRPSLLYQQRHGLLGSSVPPAEVRALDAVLAHAEIAVPAWRIRTLAEVRYAPPRLLSSPPRPRELPEEAWVRPGQKLPKQQEQQEKKQIVLGMLLRGDWDERGKAVLLILRYFWQHRPCTVRQWLRTPLRLLQLGKRVLRILNEIRKARAKQVAKQRAKGFHRAGASRPRRLLRRIANLGRRHG